MLRSCIILLLIICSAVSVSVAGGGESANSSALQEFLSRFDEISAMGFVKTARPGPTGVGYTFETLLGIKENNSPRGDFHGMEIKAYRDDDVALDDRTKMNLFLKEPVWVDGFTTADRIRQYGYVGKFNRQSWYQSVTIRQNEAGLAFLIDRDAKQVQLTRSSETIGYWQFEILEQRLREKLTEMAFVAAAARGNGADEMFHYRAVTWCSSPSLESFLKLIEAGDVILELRMHLKETGSARNHGTAFRLHKHRIRDLFSQCVRCRPLGESN